MKKLQWMVADYKGKLYACSNSLSKKGAKLNHVADMRVPWLDCWLTGDRLVQVSISIIKTLP